MRLFIAVPIPDSVVEKLYTCTKSLQGIANIRFVPKENFHCTTLFLGEKTEPECEHIIKKMKFLSDRLYSTEISLHKLVLFPAGKQNPRVLAASLKSSNQGLDVYHRIFSRELGSGRSAAGSFSPHITLARFRAGDQKNTPVKREDVFNKIVLPDITFNAEYIALYSSSLLRKGASYDPVFTIKLGL
jgi:2'-5' RNA ligase